MYDYLYEESLRRAKHRVWILSDLQQRDPDKARECLEVSMADFAAMGQPADMIWYLGDSVEGDTRAHLTAMVDMQEEAFGATGLPLCYVAGNHDFDYTLNNGEPTPYIPFVDMVRRHPGWHTIAADSDWYYTLPLGEHTVYFFSDHIAPDRSWWAFHGGVHGDQEAYPHWGEFEEVRAAMAAAPGPVITVSHYSFAGGNRESPFLSKLMPLPETVKLHFYGHAHIGDFDWAREHAYRRICWVNWHDIPQINVSSFEHIRGRVCRSVFLHIYEDNSYGIFFRDHDHGVFSECYLPAKVQYPHK